MSDLHEVRLEVVSRAIAESDAASVLDLGCGDGELMARLLELRPFEKLVGIDIDPQVIREARAVLGLDPLGLGSGPVRVMRASFTQATLDLGRFDLAVMLETVEHVDPGELGAVERAVFGTWRPREVIVTTPNQEYNVLYGLRPGAFRHPDHRFEWTRERFQRWAQGVAARHRYRVRFEPIGEIDALRGPPTQLAWFAREP